MLGGWGVCQSMCLEPGARSLGSLSKQKRLESLGSLGSMSDIVTAEGCIRLCESWCRYRLVQITLLLHRLNKICKRPRWNLLDNVNNMFMGVRFCVSTCIACPTDAFSDIMPAIHSRTKKMSFWGICTSWMTVRHQNSAPRALDVKAQVLEKFPVGLSRSTPHVTRMTHIVLC